MKKLIAAVLMVGLLTMGAFAQDKPADKPAEKKAMAKKAAPARKRLAKERRKLPRKKLLRKKTPRKKKALLLPRKTSFGFQASVLSKISFRGGQAAGES